MFINLFSARVKGSAYFIFYIDGNWGKISMLDQTMKTSNNLKWMWSFALYIDGSWRELNMLDQTMEIQRNLK